VVVHDLDIVGIAGRVPRRVEKGVDQHLAKGTKVYVEGRLKHRDYTGQDGTRVKKAEILLSHLIMLSPKPEKPVEEKLAPEEPEVPVETEA
jgi:single-strand DNA-binding protein